MASSFNFRPFFRAFSIRDVLTAFSIALLYFTVLKVLSYAEVDFPAYVYAFILIIPFILNHVVYKIEHHRPNNFVGRNIQDYIFLIGYWLVSFLHTLIFNKTFSIDVKSVAYFIVIVFISECLVALIKRLLTLMKWQIL